MFFWRKATKAAKQPVEKRSQYRKPNSKSQTLEATLRAPNWDPLRVEVLDLTVRGVAIRVPFAKDRNLAVDAVVELTIGSLMRNEIQLAARVASSEREGESHVRYGLEFLNVNELYVQLDEFYTRHFNRRRHQRVMPSLDRKVRVELAFGVTEVCGTIFDISESGMGVVLSKDSAARVVNVERFELRLTLPDVEGVLTGPAIVRHRTPMQSQTLLGVQFDLEAPEGFTKRAAELRRFVEARSAEISQWEDSWDSEP